MTNKKLNCWEYKKCKNYECIKNKIIVICPTSKKYKLNNLNNGFNGGRVCWAIPNTSCENSPKGNFLEKQSFCETCNFFKYVLDEEGIETISKNTFEAIKRLRT